MTSKAIRSISLCKIATEAGEYEDVCDDNFERFFRFDGVSWKPLPYFTLHRDFTMATLKIIKESSSCFFIEVRKEPGQSASLHVCTVINPVYRYLRMQAIIVQKLFPVLFWNYDDPTTYADYALDLKENGDNNVESKLKRRYLTTELYHALAEQHSQAPESGLNMPLHLPACFKPKLYKYQERSVRWLLYREQTQTYLPNLYYELHPRDTSNIRLYKHSCSTQLTLHEPPPIQLATGGILADDMGLGKTVEIMALILLNARANIPDFDYESYGVPAKRSRVDSTVFCICNPGRSRRRSRRQKLIKCGKCTFLQHRECVMKFENEDSSQNEPYYCPSCWSDITKQSLFESGTTFIASPHMIKKQWLMEFKRHTQPMLNVLVYEGVINGQWINPRTLAKYDVVLTDYNVLRNEIYHSSKFESERVMRHKPVSMKVRTPLLMMKWWRVCLDEAQIVESNTSNCANLVRMLPAMHRWAVTGTPIHRSLDDLQSLLRFIGVEALQNSEIWNNLINDFIVNHKVPAKRLLLIEILQKCMWRTCKSSIEHELMLPPQTEEVHRINLSNLENLFYTEQHAECEEDFRRKLQKYTDKDTQIRMISPHILKSLLHPLLKIRQCCNMPVVEDKQRSAAHKQFLHPTQLHHHLLSDNENECKSQLRQMASAMNGIAALYFINKDYRESIKNYELVLKLAADYNQKNISVDSLLQIHALKNLLEAYELSPEQAEINGFDAKNCEERLHELERKYLQNYVQTMQVEYDALEDYRSKLDSCKSKFRIPLLHFVAELGRGRCEESIEMQKQLVHRIQTDCFGLNAKLDEMYNMHGVLLVLTLWHDKLEAALSQVNYLYGKLQAIYKEIIKNISGKKSALLDTFIKSVYDCHLHELRDNYAGTRSQERELHDSAVETAKIKCDLCVMEKKMSELQGLLFVQGSNNDVLEIPTFEVCILNALFHFVKSKSKTETLKEDVKNYKRMINILNIIAKHFVRFWIEMEYTVKAYDELDMCTMRISLTDQMNERNNFRIVEAEIDSLMSEQRTNLQMAEREFAAKLGRLRYIKHLEQNIEELPCPICHLENALRYTVLECGHHMCLSCMKSVNQYYKTNMTRITCPVCRHAQKSHNVYYVTRLAPTNDVNLKGNYSSKITYIVRLVLKLLADQPEVKILIFSDWSPILNAIAEALTENKIVNIAQCTPESIEKFKNRNLGVTCLLMPLSKGSKGLNLIEATHVFLVEPILDPGEELQAIGRVHRFGQKKSTTVHRFIVNNTIEDKVFKLVTDSKETSSNWNFKNVTLRALEELFELDDANNTTNKSSDDEEDESEKEDECNTVGNANQVNGAVDENDMDDYTDSDLSEDSVEFEFPDD